ncbi:MAG TPA: homoserine dehydrogenase [Acidimicrobiales bacterium]|nr:homoserine dehydrogenase [Acidimicrobiales bacterium]
MTAAKAPAAPAAADPPHPQPHPQPHPHAHPAPTVRVALLGCGNVGGALAEILLTRADDVAARTGIRLELVGIAVANPDRPRSAAVPTELVGTDAAALVAREDVDVVVEVIGGLHPAHELVEAALRNGKPVVTANKALLATAGAELADVAAEAGVDLLYEAAVAGAIPVIRPLRESLAGEQIVRVMGIVNGTTNYILTRMEEEGDSYDDVLREAQELGLAERDPTADVEGHDAAAKAAILAALAFGSDVVDGDVHREGISGISAADVAYASRLGYSVKLLAIAELLDGGPEVSVRVHPAMVPRTHPLAAVRGAFNAVFVEGAVSGELMLYGRGAGGGPTASAMLGDLVDAARNLLAGAPAPAPKRTSTTVRDQSEMRAAFYLSMDVADRPGVLAAVAKIFGDHDVSIRAMEQVGMAEEARLIFLTHVAREGDLLATIDELRRHQAVDRVSGVLRVIGTDGTDGEAV